LNCDQIRQVFEAEDFGRPSHKNSGKQ